MYIYKRDILFVYEPNIQNVLIMNRLEACDCVKKVGTMKKLQALKKPKCYCLKDKPSLVKTLGNNEEHICYDKEKLNFQNQSSDNPLPKSF